jgi:hypothetical protein
MRQVLDFLVTLQYMPVVLYYILCLITRLNLFISIQFNSKSYDRIEYFYLHEIANFTNSLVVVISGYLKITITTRCLGAIQKKLDVLNIKMCVMERRIRIWNKNGWSSGRFRENRTLPQNFENFSFLKFRPKIWTRHST